MIQEKLVRMLGQVQATMLTSWRVSKLFQDGKMTPGHASLAKAFNTLRGREIVALAREIQGGNGILYDSGTARHFTDMEACYTYEGTYEVNTL